MQQLKEGIVLGDGGYIVELEQRGYVVAPRVPHLPSPA
jgi:hypothetical protein